MELHLNELLENNKEIDIVCLSETFVQRGHEQMANLSGFYLAAFYSRQSKQKRGGVYIFITKGLQYKQVNFNNEYSVDKHFECCAIELISQNMFIICLYRIPDSNCELFFTKLETLLHRIIYKYKNKKVVVAGDLNIDTVQSNKQESRRLIDLTQNYCLNLHIQNPTRKSSCIDHIISNMNYATGELLHLDISDHNTAQLLNIPTAHKETPLLEYFIHKRDYSVEYL